MNRNNQNAQGFTVVEIIVTLVVVALFLGLFFQAFMLLESQRINVARQAKASDVAYSNLRKFTAMPAGLTCDKTNMDLTTGGDPAQPNRGKTGTALVFTAETDVSTLGSSTTQSLVAYAPNGCDNSGNFIDPATVKIVSTVTYGLNNDKVSHATFVQ